MRSNMFIQLILIVVFCIFGSSELFAIEPGKPDAPNRQGSADLSLPDKLITRLNSASRPTSFYSIPTARIPRTMEVVLTGGSSYGEKEGGGTRGSVGLGLGGVAELELSSTQVANQLTGRDSRFPAKTFKVYLIPELLARVPFIPHLAIQLRTADWSRAIDPGDHIWEGLRQSFTDTNKNYSLQSLGLQTRFTTLYAIGGFEGKLGGLYGGMSLTDVRTRGGQQEILNNQTGEMAYQTFPPMQENILEPFGGISINANSTTQLLAEVSAIPSLDYDVKKKSIIIDRAWCGIAGIRFFMFPWLSLDTGVRYLSTFEGIADSDINLAVNAVIPLKPGRYTPLARTR